MRCTLDLGSDCSIIRDSLAQKYRLTIEPSNETLIAFNNSTVTPLGQTKANITIDGIKFDLTFKVVPDHALSSNILVGCDIFETAETRATGTELKLEKTSVLSEPKGFHFTSACHLVPISKNDVKCGDQSVVTRLVSLLNKFRDIVAVNNKHPLKTAKVPPMRINLNSKDPVYHRPYRLSVSDRKAVQEIITDMEEKGLIQEGDSPYASPIVLTKKKNGATRMCVDYRALNRITVKVKYPLPIAEDQMDTLKGKKVYIILDL